LEFSWSSTSHFPVQFGDFLPFHDLNVLTSSVFHPQIWNILTCLLSIFMGFARFLFFSEFWPIFSLSCPRRRFSLCVLQPKDPEVMPGTSFNLINESTYFW
jgi:hypothetical protein